MDAADCEGEFAEHADSFDELIREIAHVSEGECPLPEPAIGAVLGDKYRLTARLGRGGMGAVFSAVHVMTDKRVAVKWMLTGSSDDRARRRFLREARAAGRIDHPNVVDVYDMDEVGPCGYLVMELLHGEDLRARMRRGPIEPREAVDLLLPALRGVAAVHRAGVIHRDLKPENIFLCTCPDGSAREAKVLDFGISAMAGFDPRDPTLSHDGAVPGTPAYMAPERFAGVRDERTDVYSLGVILYEALTHRLPFEAESSVSLALAIAHAMPEPLSKYLPSVPRKLERVVMRALAKRPDDRFATVQELLDALLPFSSFRASRAITLASAQRRVRTLMQRIALAAAVLGLSTELWHQDAAGCEAVSHGGGELSNTRTSAWGDDAMTAKHWMSTVLLVATIAGAGCESNSVGIDASAFEGAAGSHPEPGSASGQPILLSQTGLYRDIASKALAPDLIGFEPRFSLWSDGAQKRRWLRLPEGSRIDTSDMNHWIFPIGTMLFKEFSRDGRLLETRVIARLGPSPEEYFMGAFVWNEDESDARFVPDGQRDIRGSDHDAPSTQQCTACHAGEAGRILGLSAVQGAALPAERLTRAPGTPFSVPGDPRSRDALGYLHANCGHCHNVHGSAWPSTNLDLWLQVSDATTEVTAAYRSAIDVPMNNPAFGTLRVAAGHAEQSGIHRRMASRTPGEQMPPLGTEHLDERGLASIRVWIESL